MTKTSMLKAPPRKIRLGPNDNGRRMTLDLFDRAVGQEGFVFELNKGVVEVTDVPHPKHLFQVQELKRQFFAFDAANPGTIKAIAASNETKILLATDQSERHPDLSIYLTSPPDVPDVWSIWVPVIVIEVVSKSSAKRDYQEKPAEYLEFGVDEYWILDAIKNQLTAMSRWRGQWKSRVIRPPTKYTTPKLQGFVLDLQRVMEAAK